MFASIVPIRSVPVSPLVESVRAEYEARFGPDPKERGGWYHEDDWSRISFVTSVLDHGGAFLDVGVGAGQFINAVARAEWFDSVVAVDRVRFGKYIELEPGIERHDVSVTELPFEDRSFDVVTCMEVLEHLPPDLLDPALSELRRICRGQLLMTVPFEEPEPLSPSHERRFTADDLRALFTSATTVLLDRPRMPWALLEERPGASVAPIGFRLAALEAGTIARHRQLRAVHSSSLALERARRTVARSAIGPTLKRVLRRFKP